MRQKLRMSNIAALGGLVLQLAGCAPVDSLNPLYTGSDVTYSTALVGTWVTQPGSEEIQVKVDGIENGAYVVVYKFKDGQVAFQGRLVKLGESLFLDLTSEKSTGTTSLHPESHEFNILERGSERGFDPYLFRLDDGVLVELTRHLPGKSENVCALRVVQYHWILKTRIEGDALYLAWLDDEKLVDIVDDERPKLTYEDLGGAIVPDIVLTASTRDLQQFVLKHARDATLFQQAFKLPLKRQR